MTDWMKLPDHPPHPSDDRPFWTVRLELPLEPAAVHEARTQAESTMRQWAITPSIIEDALLIVSELATNAVRHSRPPESDGQFILAMIRLPDAIQVYVADGDPRPPVLQNPADDATGGRGLLLVRELSDCWGCIFPAREEGVGKAVLAELRLGKSSLGEAGTARTACGTPSISAVDPFTRARMLSPS